MEKIWDNDIKAERTAYAKAQGWGSLGYRQRSGLSQINAFHNGLCEKEDVSAVSCFRHGWFQGPIRTLLQSFSSLYLCFGGMIVPGLAPLPEGSTSSPQL